MHPILCHFNIKIQGILNDCLRVNFESSSFHSIDSQPFISIAVPLELNEKPLHNQCPGPEDFI